MLVVFEVGKEVKTVKEGKRPYKTALGQKFKIYYCLALREL